MEVYKLSYTRSMKKFLDRLPPKQFKQVATKILTLCQNPYPTDAIRIKDVKKRYRVTIGEYRIVYQISDETIIIEVVGKRNDDAVYKVISRK